MRVLLLIWIELSTEVEAEAVESVAEIFSQIVQGGVAIEEPLLESAEPGRVEIDPSRLVIVKSYLPEGADLEAKVKRAEEALWHLSQLRRIEPLKISRLAEEDWAEAWKDFFHVQRIGSHIVIKPSWREYDAAPEDVVLELDPGMAFGTGLHPTTRMCAIACERYVRDGMRVLDVGTGSGILSLASAKLGAAQVVAVDVDPVAVDVARKNAEMNGLSERVRVLEGSVDVGASVSAGPYDLVLANIIASVIVSLAQGLYDVLDPQGTLIASGIIAEREEEVREALTRVGLRVEETMAEGDWRAMVCRRGVA
ncbi:MAG: 50S ribosomal protein L11 methyltransferase [Chloroflexota bacterium]